MYLTSPRKREIHWSSIPVWRGSHLRDIGFVILSIFAVFAFAEAASAACKPGPNEVALYQHKNFGGICSTLPIGDYTNSKKLAMPNDSVSSIQLGGNVQITACKHAITNKVTGGLGWFDDPQSCQTFKNSNKDLKRTRLGDNKISSASVKAKSESSFLDPGGAAILAGTKWRSINSRI